MFIHTGGVACVGNLFKVVERVVERVIPLYGPRGRQLVTQREVPKPWLACIAAWSGLIHHRADVVTAAQCRAAGQHVGQRQPRLRVRIEVIDQALFGGEPGKVHKIGLAILNAVFAGFVWT